MKSCVTISFFADDAALSLSVGRSIAGSSRLGRDTAPLLVLSVSLPLTLHKSMPRRHEVMDIMGS